MARLRRLLRQSSATPEERCLLIVLHGLGSDEQDMFAAAEDIDRRYAVAALRAPRPYEMGGYAWFSLGLDPSQIRYNVEEAKESLGMLRSEIPALREEIEVAPDRVILGGFSQGAIMSLAAMLHCPDQVGGALLMSGAVIPELLPEETVPKPDLPILAQHGLYDQVLPVHLGRSVRDLLGTLGYKPDYREYPMAHQVSLQSLWDAQEWLAALAT